MFNKFMLDKKDNQSRNIFDTFIYRSDTDTLAQVQGVGYFVASRFAANGSTPDKDWNGSKLEAKCSDGYYEGFIDGTTGTVTASISS